MNRPEENIKHYEWYKMEKNELSNEELDTLIDLSIGKVEKIAKEIAKNNFFITPSMNSDEIIAQTEMQLAQIKKIKYYYKPIIDKLMWMSLKPKDVSK